MDEYPQYKVLVVDDDEILNNLFSAFLGARGFYTISVHNVVCAKQILLSDPGLDLILLDYQLADGIGLELLSEEVTAQLPLMPPIIMISANDNPAFLENCFARGIADYIIKPVNLSLLALKVRSLISSMRLQRLVTLQKMELEKFKIDAQREEAVAKFIFEYLIARNSQSFKGINLYLQSHSSFSGDIAISRMSPSGDVYFLLADATGHGLSAAITIMPLVTLFNNKVDKGFRLQRIVTEINKNLVNDTPADRFVAALVVELNFSNAEISLWNGGMPTAYWIDDGKIVERFPSRHMALGILDEDMFDADITTIEMPSTGLLFMCSDGLIEQQSSTGEQFTKNRLESILNKPSVNLFQDVVSSLERHLNGAIYDDDISIATLDPFEIYTDQLACNKVSNVCTLSENISPFSWEMKIAGEKLAQTDLPSLANQFLQYIDMDQKTCQKVFSIITEMVMNGIDHGILELSSDLKQNPEGFMAYFLERERLLKKLTDADFIQLRMDWVITSEKKKLIISCRDSGKGYDYERKQSSTLYAGRGISLIQNLAASVEIFAPGNFIKVIL